MSEKTGLTILLAFMVVLLTLIAVRNCEIIHEIEAKYQILESRVNEIEHPVPNPRENGEFK